MLAHLKIGPPENSVRGLGVSVSLMKTEKENIDGSPNKLVLLYNKHSCTCILYKYNCAAGVEIKIFISCCQEAGTPG